MSQATSKEMTGKLKPARYPVFPRLPTANQDKENLSHSAADPGLKVAPASPVTETFESKSPNLVKIPVPKGPKQASHSIGSYSRRIVRYGETLESLFCLGQNSLPEHRNLSNGIAHGELQNDLVSWRRVLELASSEVARDNSSTTRGDDLIRLHRRATSRFSSMLDLEEKNRSHVLAIWLSYARAQLSYGSRDEARRTYRHIQNKRLGVTSASLYVALADFEVIDDTQKARETLVSGIDHKAQPVAELKQALSELDKSVSDEWSTKLSTEEKKDRTASVEERRAETHASTQLGSPTFSSVIPPLPSQVGASRSRKRKGDPRTILSPKRSRNERKVDDHTNDTRNTVQTSSTVSSERTDDSTNIGRLSLTTDVGSGVERNPLASLAIQNTKSTGTSGTKELEKTRNGTDGEAPRPHSVPKLKTLSPRKKGNADASRGITVISQSSRTPNPSSSTTKVPRCRISSKAPRLKPLGLGRAQRVNPYQPYVDGSEDSLDEIDSCTKDATQKTVENGPANSKAVPKFTKMDLSYMLNWDPEESRRNRKGTKTAGLVTNTEASDANTERRAREGIGEMSVKGSGKSAVTESSMIAASVNSGSKEDCHSSDEHHTEPKVTQELVSCPTTADPLPARTPHSESSALVEKSNMDFLPLVSEGNMLRVNNVPYAKLGVIGKGGSCKVYRALSKECSVLAIKKVKLGGKDRKAVDGYANEISLLKRLRGNPAIIQMYDSEVDLSRKAIFVVMELGEVDLNQVLQKQTLNVGDNTHSEKRLSLNMNFIRLTWQQMLSAVHSIHEERIIHGDLKPANFLFVRGALKLIDFGIAKAIQSDDTTNIYRDSQIGTLNYMSPEAILDTGSGPNGAQMKIGRASDIWSLGCILYQMVCGRTPFAELHMIQKLQAIVNPNHKITFPENVDEAAVDAMKLCLRRDPELRPPIFGKNGLLNEHWFLHSKKRRKEQ